MSLLFQMANLENQLNHAQFDTQRILDVMEYSQRESTPIRSNTLIAPEKNSLLSRSYGKIEIIDLTFGYNRGGKPLFSQLNLIIEPYSKVAITGPSGSGKSTLANLISGLYVPWSGVILIDGIPVSDLSREKRTSLLTLISQEQFFVKGSLKDNLCLWDKHYPESELLRVMQIACIDDLVVNSNDGFNFQLTEGATNLSGGQRQRLEIARSILRNSHVLILDEATSALDPLIEEQVIKNIFKNSPTNIWIAHRFTTIRNADKIFILNEGKLIDSGSHQTLVNQKSDVYFDLFKMDIQKEMSV